MSQYRTYTLTSCRLVAKYSQVASLIEEEMMKSRRIRGDSWLFRVAYLFTSKAQLPKKVNLCQLVPKVAINSLLLVEGVCIIALVVGAIGYIFGTIIIGVVRWLVTEFRWSSAIETVTAPSLELKVALSVALTFLLACVYIVYLTEAPHYFRRWLMKFEVARLAGDYLRAKKEKICPTYDVVEGDKKEDRKRSDENLIFYKRLLVLSSAVCVAAVLCAVAYGYALVAFLVCLREQSASSACQIPSNLNLTDLVVWTLLGLVGFGAGALAIFHARAKLKKMNEVP